MPDYGIWFASGTGVVNRLPVLGLGVQVGGSCNKVGVAVGNISGAGSVGGGKGLIEV